MNYFYCSENFNPYYNLAIEEYLLSYAELHNNTYILYLWQNDNSVVIGRNQDAFSEVNFDNLNYYNTFLARRKTGGGAVYHDKNNLNFSFITPKIIFNKQKSMQIIKNAIEKFGLKVEISGRNDLLINWGKFSGSAYLNKLNTVLHHGTILIDTNVDILSKVLTVNQEKLKNHSVKSVSSRVLNLKTLNSDISVENVKNEIKNEFSKIYGIELNNLTPDNSQILEIEKFYSDENWILGDKKFVSSKSHYKKFNFGLCQIKEYFSDNQKHFKIYSDCLDNDLIFNIQKNINKRNYKDISLVLKDIEVICNS